MERQPITKRELSKTPPISDIRSGAPEKLFSNICKNVLTRNRKKKENDLAMTSELQRNFFTLIPKLYLVTTNRLECFGVRSGGIV